MINFPFIILIKSIKFFFKLAESRINVSNFFSLKISFIESFLRYSLFELYKKMICLSSDIDSDKSFIKFTKEFLVKFRLEIFNIIDRNGFSDEL